MTYRLFYWPEIQGRGTDAVSERYPNSSRAPHPLQQSFIDEGAAQCGFCLSGIILTAKAVLDKKPDASDEEIGKALGGVLCRCFTHLRMLRAIRFAAQLDFTIAEKTWEGIKMHTDRIRIITQERITEELNKILLSPKPSVGLDLKWHPGLAAIGAVTLKLLQKVLADFVPEQGSLLVLDTRYFRVLHRLGVKLHQLLADG